jgi:hypothetical protein
VPAVRVRNSVGFRGSRVLEQNLSADTLALIATHNDDPAVLRPIARHPNTPPLLY